MENMVNIDLFDNYKGKKVFVTGHTGFKGTWLCYLLSKHGAILKGYSLEPNTNPSLFLSIRKYINIESIFADINDPQRLEQEILEFEPDFIFHLAAQPLVRKSYKEPLDTFATNILGTANLLNSIISLEKTCVVILITTDKVYDNKEWNYPYREIDKLGGYDPYSSSKAAAELIINSYRSSYFNLDDVSKHKKLIASVRAGNVIGGGDWTEDRLIPDIIKSLVDKRPVIIRNPYSIRPWQHVLEPIFGYLKLGINLLSDPKKFSGSWNFGPNLSDNLSVISIANKALEIWGEGEIEIQESLKNVHEAKLLKLDISKAKYELNWEPIMDSNSAILKTIEWYKSFYKNNELAIDLVENDINFFFSKKNG
jgi:CDP-glucose 4,6-dehydratase